MEEAGEHLHCETYKDYSWGFEQSNQLFEQSVEKFQEVFWNCEAEFPFLKESARFAPEREIAVDIDEEAFFAMSMDMEEFLLSARPLVQEAERKLRSAVGRRLPEAQEGNENHEFIDSIQTFLDRVTDLEESMEALCRSFNARISATMRSVERIHDEWTNHFLKSCKTLTSLQSLLDGRLRQVN